MLKPGQDLLSFIIKQRKGPTQFLVTYLVGLLQPEYQNNFLTRLPFALAGILAVGVFYQVIQLHYGKKIGLFAALFFSLNGIFIGLSRIAQYQSLVLLFSVLTLYFFSLAAKENRLKIGGIYLGVCCWAAALLTHYDGIFIAPYAIYLLIRWYKAPSHIASREKGKHLVLASALFTILLIIFFIPFGLSVSNATQSYWLERLMGEGAADQLPSSIITFTLYNPTIILYIDLLLVLSALVYAKSLLPVILWAILPWSVLEILVFDPGTHIYNYLLPACVMLAFGLKTLETALNTMIKGRARLVLTTALPASLFVFLFMVAHLIFIDHTPEYPWNNRGILGWVVGLPDEKYRVWPYGFPYNRRWDEIGDFVKLDQNSTYYSTNENKSIASYHIPYPFDIDKAGYYIHIYHPQSLHDRIASDKIRYWLKNHPPLKVFKVNNQVVSEIYFMPAGSFEEIRQAGY